MSRHSIPNPDTVDWGRRFLCGTCGERFATKSAKKAHKADCISDREWERIRESLERQAAEVRERRPDLEAEWLAYKPHPNTIDGYIEQARKEMGEARWKQLNQEWLNREGG